LTTLLIFMLAANSLGATSYLFSGQRFSAIMKTPMWVAYMLALGCATNIFLTISIFRWKKWAFYALCAVTAATFGINISIGVPPIHAAIGLLGPVVLYGVLQIGGENKGWPQLK
jgi:hypothetical protein